MAIHERERRELLRTRLRRFGLWAISCQPYNNAQIPCKLGISQISDCNEWVATCVRAIDLSKIVDDDPC
jgi:hypothetical protein